MSDVFPGEQPMDTKRLPPIADKVAKLKTVRHAAVLTLRMAVLVTIKQCQGVQ